MIKVTEAEERLKFFEFLGLGPICNGGKFGRVHFNLAMGDNDTKILNESLIKRAFLGFEVKVIFGKVGENFMDKFIKVGEVVIEHEDVIQVDYKV